MYTSWASLALYHLRQQQFTSFSGRLGIAENRLLPELPELLTKALQCQIASLPCNFLFRCFEDTCENTQTRGEKSNKFNQRQLIARVARRASSSQKLCNVILLLRFWQELFICINAFLFLPGWLVSQFQTFPWPATYYVVHKPVTICCII